MIVFAKDGNVEWENSFDEEVAAGKDNLACPVCGEKTLKKRGNWECCPNCHWIDDLGQSEEFPDETDCANKMSLNQAREAYSNGERVV